jgi:hypothetical protein
MLRVSLKSVGFMLLAAMALVSPCASSGPGTEGSDDGGECRGIPPPELDGPWYPADMTIGSIGTGNDLLFQVQVTDASGVYNVTVEHWQGKAWPHNENVLTLASGNLTDGVWEVSIPVPPDSLISIRYRFHAIDIHLNKNWTPEKAIYVADDDKPTLDIPSSLPNVTSGQPYQFRVGAHDNIGVASVRVLVKVIDRNWKMMMVELVATDTTGMGNGSWEGTIAIPPNIAGRLMFVVYALDTSGNPADNLYAYALAVDRDPPAVRGSSPVYTLAGVDLVFTAEAEDNIGVVSVRVVYRIGEGDTRRTTSHMTGITINSRGNGTYSSGNVAVPAEDIGNIFYTLYAEDAQGNVGSTGEMRVEVIVDEPPTILEDMTDPAALTGQVFHIRVSLADDSGIEHAWASYSFAGIDDDEAAYVNMLPDSVTSSGNGTYMYRIHVPEDATGRIWYRFEIADVHGRSTTSEWYWKPVKDGIPPTVGPDLSDTVAERGQYFAFRVVAEDNIGVTRVRLTYWFTDGVKELVDLEGSGTYALYLMVSSHARGYINYRFTAYDAGGNENSTLLVMVPVINPPPIVLAIPPWTVTEGVPAELDLSDFIGDPNDDQNTLLLTCDDPNVTAMGFVLRACFDRWAPERWLEFEVSDGSEVTRARLRLMMVDVNHPPTVSITSPFDGAELEPGVNVPLVAVYWDVDIEEGRDLRVTWTSSAAGTLLAFNHSMAPADPGALLPPGFHTITVTVSDGASEGSDQVTVFVKGSGVEDPSDQGGEWSPFAPGGEAGTTVLILVAAVGLALVAWFVRERGRPGRELTPP